MSEITSINAGMTSTGNGSVRSSSPLSNNNNTNTDSPQIQQQRQTNEVTSSELSDLNENTWFSIGKILK